MAVMTWFVVYPGAFICKIFKLFSFSFMDFKMLLLALAALNFLLSFVVEVSDDVRHELLPLLRWNVTVVAIFNQKC